MKRTEKHAKALQSASTTSIVDSKSGLQKTKQALNVQFLADQLFPFNPVQNQLKKIIHIATPISLINHSSLSLLFCQMSECFPWCGCRVFSTLCPRGLSLCVNIQCVLLCHSFRRTESLQTHLEPAFARTQVSRQQPPDKLEQRNTTSHLQRYGPRRLMTQWQK